MFVIAAALTGLLVVLATLQYVWLGRVSEAERASRQSMLSARAAAVASEFDKELTLAYVLFQVEPVIDSAEPRETLASRFAARDERWQAAARFPRLIKDRLIASVADDGTPGLERYDAVRKAIEPAAWPEGLSALRAQLAALNDESTSAAAPGSGGGTFVVRRMPAVLWDDVPAVVVPMPLVLFNAADHSALAPSPRLSFTVLVLDREVLTGEMLPALTAQHLRGLGDGVDYDFAIVSAEGRGPVYQSSAGFAPAADARVDASADLFQVRTQDFAQLAADVRRFTMAVTPPGGHAIATITRSKGTDRPAPGTGATSRDSRPTMVWDQAAALRGRAIVTSVAGGITRSASTPKWRLLVKHPSGSLEAAVNSTRRRNLLVSSTILAVLGASMALLVLSARRSQEIARQQMEFVAAVSHELRTPLAVIRSAGDNLAHGVIADGPQVRKYGELVRSEGRRLSEMVEQILEFAGIQSGQRKLEPRPVDLQALLQRVLSASDALIEDAVIDVEVDVPADLPPVRGDEPALRRVFQNLVGNAIKYGGDGRWIGIRARPANREVSVTIADRGLGIAASEQARIFEPFYRAAEAVEAQIQGAGLGLSLVQRIVEAHGGRIDVTSAPGQGSAFTIHLPAANPEPVPDAEPRPAEAPRYT